MSFSLSGILAPARRAFLIGCAAFAGSLCALAQNYPFFPLSYSGGVNVQYNAADGFVYTYGSVSGPGSYNTVI